MSFYREHRVSLNLSDIFKYQVIQLFQDNKANRMTSLKCKRWASLTLEDKMLILTGWHSLIFFKEYLIYIKTDLSMWVR